MCVISVIQVIHTFNKKTLCVKSVWQFVKIRNKSNKKVKKPLQIFIMRIDAAVFCLTSWI